MVILGHVMGVHASIADSPFMSYLNDDFHRVLKSRTGGVIYFHQIQQLQPPQDCPLDLRHLATLWKLDENHDGCVTLEELVTFAEYCNEKRRIFGALDFHSKLKAQCDVDLWDVISSDKGQELFVEWVCALIAQGEAQRTFEVGGPDIKFISRDAVMTLYELMKPYQISSHVDQQGFLDQLQQIGEHLGLMSLLAEELDDWVPVEVVHRWVKSFTRAFHSLFQELCLVPPRSSQE